MEERLVIEDIVDEVHSLYSTFHRKVQKNLDYFFENYEKLNFSAMHNDLDFIIENLPLSKTDFHLIQNWMIGIGLFIEAGYYISADFKEVNSFKYLQDNKYIKVRNYRSKRYKINDVHISADDSLDGYLVIPMNLAHCKSRVFKTSPLMRIIQEGDSPSRYRKREEMSKEIDIDVKKFTKEVSELDLDTEILLVGDKLLVNGIDF